MDKIKKVLLTGGAGFIGSHTLIALHNMGYQPIVVDDMRNSHDFILENIKDIIKDDLIFYSVDCCDAKAMKNIFENHKDMIGVIHFAAYKAVGESVANPTMYYKNNVQSLNVILDLMQEFNINNIVFSSSCTVYGSPDFMPVTEETPIKYAESPYGFTKQIGERICGDWTSANNKKAVLLRYFNPIGAHESGSVGELPIGRPQNLIPYITQSAIGKLGPLTVHGDDYETDDGSCVRDYIHVMDLAEAHVKSLEFLFDKDDQGVEVFNVATGRGASVLELVNSFIKVNKVDLNFSIGPRRSGDVPAIFADCSKAEKMIGWKARYTMEDALKHSWEWEKNLKDKYADLI